MSLKTIIRKAGTKCDIKSVTEAKGAGGKLTKVWAMRYHNVSCRLNAKMTTAEMLYYEKASIFPDFIMFIQYRSGIRVSDKVVLKGRTFDIKKVDNYDEIGLYLKIALQETDAQIFTEEVYSKAFILGDGDLLPVDWGSAVGAERDYGYLCDGADGLFSNDIDPGKRFSG